MQGHIRIIQRRILIACVNKSIEMVEKDKMSMHRLMVISE